MPKNIETITLIVVYFGVQALLIACALSPWALLLWWKSDGASFDNAMYYTAVPIGIAYSFGLMIAMKISIKHSPFKYLKEEDVRRLATENSLDITDYQVLNLFQNRNQVRRWEAEQFLNL